MSQMTHPLFLLSFSWNVHFTLWFQNGFCLSLFFILRLQKLYSRQTKVRRTRVCWASLFIGFWFFETSTMLSRLVSNVWIQVSLPILASWVAGTIGTWINSPHLKTFSCNTGIILLIPIGWLFQQDYSYLKGRLLDGLITSQTLKAETCKKEGTVE
jgi:hypothetical protein